MVCHAGYEGTDGFLISKENEAKFFFRKNSEFDFHCISIFTGMVQICWSSDCLCLSLLPRGNPNGFLKCEL